MSMGETASFDRLRMSGKRLTLGLGRGYTLFVSFFRRVEPVLGRGTGESAEDSTPRSAPVLPLYMKVLRLPMSVAGLEVRVSFPWKRDSQPRRSPPWAPAFAGVTKLKPIHTAPWIPAYAGRGKR